MQELETNKYMKRNGVETDVRSRPATNLHVKRPDSEAWLLKLNAW